MTNEQYPSTPPLHGVYTRRGMLKGALAASAGALALSAFGGNVAMQETLVSAAEDEMLPASKFTIKSTIAVNVTKHFARTPLFQGTFNGQPVWYVITESSDERIASDLGLNFAPRLANIPAGSPAVQQVASANPVLGRDMVTFVGAPNFAPTRSLVAGPKGFPPNDFHTGADADAKYSDLVRLGNVVYNAPIIAVGAGPFDVVAHTNTHDRLLGIDTTGMTADLLMVRAFSHGQDIFYHSFSASNYLTAVIERGTFIPALMLIPSPNTRTSQEGARSSIFAFANGQTVLASPPGQGLNHVIINGHNAENANPQDGIVQEALRLGGDAHNVLDAFPTLRDPALARLYTPLWDLQIPTWTDAAVAQGLNTAQKDGNQIRQLAAQGLILATDNIPLVEENVIVNCPVIAFINQAPEAPQAADPGRGASLTRGAP